MNTDAAVVLLVEDESALVELYALWLSEYETVTATTGANALAAAADHEIAMVVLDQTLPDMTGEEVAAELRARGCDAPMIMASGSEPTCHLETYEIEAWLEKPVAKTELCERVAGVFGM